MSVFMAGNTYVGVVGARALRRDVCIRERVRIYSNKDELTDRKVIAETIRNFGYCVRRTGGDEDYVCPPP